MTFAFRNQPLKAFAILGGVVYILIALPVWTIANALPSTRPKRSWPLKRVLVVRAFRAFIDILYSTSLLPSTPLEKLAGNAAALGFVWVEPAPEDLIVGDVREMAERNKVKVERTGGFWIGPRGPNGEHGQRASPEEKVVYHLHGGGYVQGSACPKTGSDVLYEGLLAYLGPDIRIFALEYRISSAAPFAVTNPFPAALLDAISGYRYLVHEIGFDPRRILLSGDSAGGGLAFNLARYLAIARLPSLPDPAGALLLSPTMDWAQTHTGPESSMVRNTSSDFVHTILECGYTARALVGDLPVDTAEKNAWISPGSRMADVAPGMYNSLPRMLMIAGGGEYTLDAMRTMGDTLNRDMSDGRFTYVEVPDATHDFLLGEWNEPERTSTLEEIGIWAKDVW